MRTLPLGVLIVCGGTFAALPFRRYQPEYPPASDLFQVTGPVQSALQPLDFEPSNLRADVLRLDSASDLRVAVDDEADQIQDLSDSAEINRVPGSLTRRSIDIPLTFEDLTQPIEHPGTAKDRWVETEETKPVETNDEYAGLLVMDLESPGSNAQENAQDSVQDSGIYGDTMQDTKRSGHLSKSKIQPTNRLERRNGQGNKRSLENEALWPTAEQRWTAEQVFPQAEPKSLAQGRFVSSPTQPSAVNPSTPLREQQEQSRHQGDAADKRYSSSWRALPDVEESERRHHWIQQP